MKKPSPRAEHLFRLHPHITCERSAIAGDLQLNYGIGSLPVERIGEFLGEFGLGTWEIDQSSLADGNGNLYKSIRVIRDELQASTSIFRLIESLRENAKSHARYENNDEISASVRLWVWSVFTDERMLKSLQREEEEERFTKIVALQEYFPALCLELTTIISTTDSPLSFKEYRALSLKVKTKVEELLEECPPRYMGIIKNILGSSIKTGKRSLVKSFQKRTHDSEWAKKYLTRKPKSLQ